MHMILSAEVRILSLEDVQRIVDKRPGWSRRTCVVVRDMAQTPYRFVERSLKIKADEENHPAGRGNLSHSHGSSSAKFIID